MLYTNGKLIVIANNNLDELDQYIAKMQKRARELNGNKKIKFSFNESPFPHYTVTPELSYDQLKEAAEGVVELNFRALGNEIITLPGRKRKEIKHHYSPEEKNKIAEEFTELQYDKEQTEEEKKTVNKQYADKISVMEQRISHLSSLHRQGYEIRNEEVLEQLDFANGMKYFVNPDTNEVLHSQELSRSDYQMRMEYTDGFMQESEPPAGAATGEPTANDTTDPEKGFEDFDNDSQDNVTDVDFEDTPAA